MPVITHKTQKDERISASLEFADAIKELSDENRRDEFCRVMLTTGAGPLLKELAALLSEPLEKIKSDRKILFMVLNARYLVDCLSAIVRRLGMINDRVLLDSPYAGKKEAGLYPAIISADVATFYMWLLIHGGSGQDIRKDIDARSAAKLQKTERAYGSYAFTTLIVRAEIALRALSKHILLPACRAHLEGKDESKINCIAAAFAAAKKKG